MKCLQLCKTHREKSIMKVAIDNPRGKRSAITKKPFKVSESLEHRDVLHTEKLLKDIDTTRKCNNGDIKEEEESFDAGDQSRDTTADEDKVNIP